MSRIGESERRTKETDIQVRVDLDGTGKSEIQTSQVFFKHMLQSFSTHSLIDLELKGTGDLAHHIIEDTGLVLGKAIKKALGNRQIFRRFGYAIVPMDCSRAQVCLDISNRPWSEIDLSLSREMIEDTASEDINHFFTSISQSLGLCLHMEVQCGSNDHHKVEAAFKGFALALRDAISTDTERNCIPSSKGVL